MQCSSCHFENMPGIEACGRCGATLLLASMAVDVHPPRARRWARWWRKWSAPARRLRFLPDLLLAALESQFGPISVEQPATYIVPRMVVPGWPQMGCGRVGRGSVLLVGYLATLLPGLVFAGTVAGSVLLGLALAFHASSVLDIVFAGALSLEDRATRSLVYLLLVAGVVYLPAGWLITRVASPRTIARAVPPTLHAGDVFLFSRAAYYLSEPQIGDVVFYRVPDERVTRRTGRGAAAVYDLGGEWIDRVLAGPGQRATWENRQLWVDGRPSPWRPLNPYAVPTRLEITVPDDAYLILPSTNPLRPSGITHRLGIVRAENVLGKVLVRSHPMSRFWIVR